MQKPNELWKPIFGYANRYFISSFGRVKNKDNEFIKPQICRGGYLGVNLVNKKFYIHRLVLSHFSQRIKNHNIINHIDENKLNNNIANLEWSTAVKNSLHSKVNFSKRKPVSQYSFSGKLIKNWPGIILASKSTGIVRQNITACINGRRKNAGGFIWK